MNLYLRLKARHTLSLLFCTLCILLSFPCSAETSAKLSLSNSDSRIYLGEVFHTYEDQSGHHNIQSIAQLQRQGLFSPLDNPSLQFGYRQSAIWLNVELSNPSDQPIQHFFEMRYPPLDRIDVFLLNRDDRITQHFILGDRQPYTDRPIESRLHLAPLTFEANETYRLFVRVESKSSLALSSYLSSVDRFYEQEHFDQIIIGMFYGLAFGLFFYNLFLLFIVKDIVYLHYICYVLGYTLFMASMDGLLFSFWPEAIEWENRSLYIFPWVCGIFLCFFVKTVLQTEQESPNSDLLLKIFYTTYIIGAVSFLFVDIDVSAALTSPIIASNAFCILGITIVRFLQGFKAAAYFIVGMGSFSIGILAIAAGAMNLHDLYELAPYVFKAGAAIEMIMFSVALGQRITTLETTHLQHLAKMKDDFLANTSHELRTPLNGIIGIADSMLENNKHLNTQDKRQLSLISSSAHRLGTLVNDILDLSKIEQQDVVINKRPLNIKLMIDAVIELSRSLLENRDLRLTNHIDPYLPAIYADEDRIYQVLHNLVSNAIKFTPSGHIYFDAHVSDKKMIVSVTDTGIGISKDKQTQIFHPFEQADSSIERHYGGTGLGLAITKELIELHGGRLWLQSTPGKGSSFSFSIPELKPYTTYPTSKSSFLTRTVSQLKYKALDPSFQAIPESATLSRREDSDLAKDIKPTASAATEQVLSEDFFRPRILAVDDEPINIEVLRSQLPTSQFDLTIAYSGEQALNIVQEDHPFDLVLLDIMMPGLSGYDVCKKLRERYSEDQLPILMLTAKNQIEDLVDAFEAGANDYLTKPFVKDELLARMDVNLKLKAASAALLESYQIVEQKVAQRTKELEETNKRLDEARDQAVLARNEITELTSMAGHELRTPVSVLRCELELLVDGIRQVDDKALNSLLEEVQHLSSLINDMFDLVLSDSRSLNYKKDSVRLDELLVRTIERFEHQFKDREIDLSLDLDHIRDKSVFADPIRIQQVCDNLLRNSLEYTDTKGKLVIGTKETDSALQVHFQDSAPGVNEQDLPRLFDRFYRVEKSRNRSTGGSGLGLAICQTIMRDHGGEISVQPSPFDGLWFIITFPKMNKNEKM